MISGLHLQLMVSSFPPEAAELGILLLLLLPPPVPLPNNPLLDLLDDSAPEELAAVAAEEEVTTPPPEDLAGLAALAEPEELLPAWDTRLPSSFRGFKLADSTGREKKREELGLKQTFFNCYISVLA